MPVILTILRLVRQIPGPVRELVVEILKEIATSKEKELVARRALEAARTKSLDELMKGTYG